MPNYPLEEDQQYRRVVAAFDRAARDCKKALSELRRYYLNTDTPDLTRAAILQQTAHNAEHALTEAHANLSKFLWELTPYGKSKDHLERVASIKIAAKERIATSPRKPTHKQVMIITSFNDVTRPKG